MQANIDDLVITRKTEKPRVFDAANIILLVALVIAIGWIFKQSRDQAALKRSMTGAEGTLCGPQSSQVGDILPPFKTQRVSGEPAEISYDGTSKYLLFIFAPTCEVCAHELPMFNKLSSQFQASGYRVKGISIDPLDESRRGLKDQELTFEMIMMPNMALRRTYRVVSIPQIMVVTSRGQVEWVHNGALTDDKVSDLLSRVSKSD